MATTNTIPDHFPIQFDKNWSHGTQQKIARLREYANLSTGCTGKAKTHNRIDSERMEEQTVRLQKTQGTELTVRKRWVFPRPHAKATYLDEHDKDLLGETVLPTGGAVVAHRMAAARALDKVLLDGISGENQEGGDNDTPNLTAKTRTAAQTVAGITGGTPTGNLSLQALIDTKSIFGQNEVYGQDQMEAGETLCLAVNQLAIDSLLGETELTSADYNTVRALSEGKGNVNEFLGFRFVRTEQLPVNDGHSSDGVYCLAWVKSLIHLDIWAEFNSTITIRHDLSEAIQIRSKFMAGACRLQEEAVVWIDCDQTA